MARSTIKGLTIEIGGDTTKLGSALQDVEKKSRDLSTELQDINKRLKFDPKNTELLAQKQKVLTEQIEATAEKLDTLKKAEKQVQQQFKKGEVSEEQVRALKREIIETEGKLEAYQKEAKGAAKQTDKFTESAKDAEKTSGGLGKALASAAKTGLAAIGAAAGAAVAGLTAAAEESREYRTAMGKLNTAFTQQGFTAEQATSAYKELQGVLGDTDVSVEAANHLAKLTNNEKDLKKWTGDILPGVFATFGDSLPIEGLTEAANETAKVGAVTGPLADALNWAGVSEEAFNEQLAKCNTEQQRQALITKTLTGLYGDASKAYKEQNAEVIRANQANEEWMASMAGIGAAFEPVITDVKMMGASLLSELVPGVQAVSEAFRGMLGGEDGAAAQLGEALSGIITQLLTKVTELAPMLVNVAMSLITTLTTTIVSMLPQLLTTGVQMLTTIMDGLVQAIPQLTQAIVAMIPQLVQALVDGIPQLIVGAVQLFNAILQAIPQIIPPLLMALPDIVMAVIDGLMQAIPQLLQGAISFLMAIVKALPTIVSRLAAAIPTILDTLVNFLTSNIDVLLDAAITLLMAILDALPVIIRALTGALPKIINTIIKFLIDNIDVLVQAAITMFMAIIEAIPAICDAIVDNLPQIIGTIVTGLVKAVPKIASAAIDLGKGLVKGLWEGVKNLGSWLWDKLTGWAGDIVGWIADKLKINSPSRVARDFIGKNFGLGVAEGVDDSVPTVKHSVGDLGDAMVDGFTLESNMRTRGAQQAAQVSASASSGLADWLDRILTAIEKGQVIALDGKLLVGGTAEMYDATLGQRRILAARGAL